LLNSTPLGEVITEQQLRRHRLRAGLRIGDAQHIDFIRYVAWMVQERHLPKSEGMVNSVIPDLTEATKGAAVLGSRWHKVRGRGQELTAKQEILIAALLTEPTYAAAAAKAGVGQATLYRWLHLRDFRAAYRRARRELVESAIGRIQAASGQAVETLLTIARQSRRDSIRVRAAIALLDHACRGLANADMLHGEQEVSNDSPMNTADVVSLLATRLRQLDQAELPAVEKSRLTATLADALLRAIGVDVLDKRLEALQAVLLDRKNKQQ